MEITNDYRINDKIISDEKMEEVGYSIVNRGGEVDNLLNMIPEANDSDSFLMKEDISYLMSIEDLYVFSSRSTNSYIAQSDNKEEFELIASEMLA